MVKDKEPTEVAEVDETTALLQQAAAELAKAASARGDRADALKGVETALSKIKLVDAPELAESPVVQAFLKTMGMDDLRPGETKHRGTLAERSKDWTIADVNVEVKAGRMPLKTFTPNETLPLTWNGITVQVIAGEECEVPECFYNIYRERQEAIKQGRLHEAYLLGKSNVAPHPNYLAESSAKVRAFSMMGPNGQAAGTLTTGRIIEGIEEEKGA